MLEIIWNTNIIAYGFRQRNSTAELYQLALIVIESIWHGAKMEMTQKDLVGLQENIIGKRVIRKFLHWMSRKL